MEYRPFWYKLDENKNPVPCSIEEAEEVYRNEKIKRVRFNRIEKYKIDISTVFLPLDQNHFGKGKPIVFETMIFWNEKEELHHYQEQYCTWNEALKGHRETVRMVIKILRERENEIV